MKIYLSGAITKNDSYFREFYEAEEKLRNKGFDVFNPIDYQFNSYYEYLRFDLANLLTCDYIYYVNDTISSKGAFVETIVAEAVGIKELKEEDIDLISDSIKNLGEEKKQLLEEVLIKDNKAMRKAGCSLAEASLEVIRNYDGIHRLSLEVANWAKVVANEGRRDELYGSEKEK